MVHHHAPWSPTWNALTRLRIHCRNELLAFILLLIKRNYLISHPYIDSARYQSYVRAMMILPDCPNWSTSISTHARMSTKWYRSTEDGSNCKMNKFCSQFGSDSPRRSIRYVALRKSWERIWNSTENIVLIFRIFIGLTLVPTDRTIS